MMLKVHVHWRRREILKVIREDIKYPFQGSSSGCPCSQVLPLYFDVMRDNALYNAIKWCATEKLTKGEHKAVNWTIKLGIAQKCMHQRTNQRLTRNKNDRWMPATSIQSRRTTYHTVIRKVYSLSLRTLPKLAVRVCEISEASNRI